MTQTLAIQILVYMSILTFLGFAWGYSKGHKDGIQIGMHRARALARLSADYRYDNR